MAVQISAARVRELWMDPTLSIKGIEAKAGCDYCTVSRRAKDMGLPTRNKIKARVKFERGPLFAAMWRSGVSGYRMGDYFGVHQSSISRAAEEMNLPHRKDGQASCMSLSMFFEILLAARMKAARDAEIAAQKGNPRAVAEINLEALFPWADASVSLTDQEWFRLHSMGLTAKEAAARRGLCHRSAYKWSGRKGLTWPSAVEARHG